MKTPKADGALLTKLAALKTDIIAAQQKRDTQREKYEALQARLGDIEDSTNAENMASRVKFDDDTALLAHVLDCARVEPLRHEIALQEDKLLDLVSAVKESCSGLGPLLHGHFQKAFDAAMDKRYRELQSHAQTGDRALIWFNESPPVKLAYHVMARLQAGTFSDALCLKIIGRTETGSLPWADDVSVLIAPDQFFQSREPILEALMPQLQSATDRQHGEESFSNAGFKPVEHLA